jgi:glycosyltransferase involved in cell wall biosynthesis
VKPGGALRLLQVNPTSGWRGGEAQTLHLCRGLAARGHDVLLAAAPGEPLAERARADGIATRGVRIRGDGDLLGIAALGRIAALFRPDLIHLHTSRAHAAGWALSLLSPNVPLIVSRRVDFVPGRSLFARMKYSRRVDRFIAVSRRVAEVLVEAGVDRARVRTVYSGVPQREAPDAATRAGARAALALPDGAPLFGSVGALAPHKDPLTLVRAGASLLRRRPDARLLLVGDGPLRSAVERESERLGVRERVVLPGFRGDPIVCLSLLDVFAVASHLEGLNTSILDAMALGRPIVATRAGGIPELIENGVEGLLVPPRDPEALAGRIAELLDDPAAAARLGAAARERSRAFTEERMVIDTEAVYRDVLAARATARGSAGEGRVGHEGATA